MISSGYFKVSREVLDKMTDEEKKKFLQEMRDYGGRISHHQWQCWVELYGL